METWSGVTDALRTDSLTLKDRDTHTQLLIKYKSGALVAQFFTTEDEKTTFQWSKVFFEDIFIFWYQIFVCSIGSVVFESGERYPPEWSNRYDHVQHGIFTGPPLI